jgi:hypothetical protein
LVKATASPTRTVNDDGTGPEEVRRTVERIGRGVAKVLGVGVGVGDIEREALSTVPPSRRTSHPIPKRAATTIRPIMMFLFIRMSSF